MRHRRRTILVTGPIGSGKSLVCACLAGHGVPVYDCDARTKTLYNRRPALVAALEKALGQPLRHPDGTLDRARLAQVIFSSPQAREKLEALVYPAVLQDFKRWRARRKGAPLVVLESAVILSKPLFDGLADEVILVTAPPEVRLARVQERDGLTREQVIARMDAQPPIPSSAVTHTLVNDGNPEELCRRAETLVFRK